MGSASDVRDAKAFAAKYRPAEGDHPDLESRVVMFRRAVKKGRERTIAVHARTLVRFVRQLGMEIPKPAKKAAAKKAAGGSGS